MECHDKNSPVLTVTNEFCIHLWADGFTPHPHLPFSSFSVCLESFLVLSHLLSCLTSQVVGLIFKSGRICGIMSVQDPGKPLFITPVRVHAADKRAKICLQKKKMMWTRSFYTTPWISVYIICLPPPSLPPTPQQSIFLSILAPLPGSICWGAVPHLVPFHGYMPFK